LLVVVAVVLMWAAEAEEEDFALDQVFLYLMAPLIQ
jgi:hypothetical protein